MNHKVAVGSTNPVKVKAVTIAFSKVWPETIWEVNGYAVSSGVSSQPMSDAECIKGARNRADAVLKSSEANFGVGLEGGVQRIGEWWFDCGWAVVVNRENIVGIGSSARIITPPKMMAKLESGMELADVVDYFFNTKNAKQGQGHFGLMTNNAINRTDGYADGVIMALARYLHPELF